MKGVLKANSTLWDWFGQITANTIQRKLVRVSLLGETGRPTKVWTLTNAWPTQVTRVEGTFGDDEVAVELVEFVYEGMTLSSH
jgi:phage tail-like protein